MLFALTPDRLRPIFESWNSSIRIRKVGGSSPLELQHFEAANVIVNKEYVDKQYNDSNANVQAEMVNNYLA